VLGFGNVYPLIPDPLKRNNASSFKISNIEGINKLITYLEGSSFYGAKALDYTDFCKAINIINNKGHFQEEGRLKLRNLKGSTNSKRSF
jgi:hypothetical protein